MGGNPSLTKIVAEASQKAETVSFVWEPFAVFAYDSLAKHVIISMRPDEQRMQVQRFRQRMIEKNVWSEADIENRLSLLTSSVQVNVIQRMWDEMFMIDLYPDNRDKFGVNWSREIEMVRASLPENTGT